MKRPRTGTSGSFFFKSCTFNSKYLVVSWFQPVEKNINWIGSSAQVGVKIKSLWNNHLAHSFSIAASSFCSLYRCAPCCLLPQALVSSHHIFLSAEKIKDTSSPLESQDPHDPPHLTQLSISHPKLHQKGCQELLSFESFYGGTISTHLFKNNHPNCQVGVHKLGYQPQLTIQSLMSNPSNAGV